MPRISTKAAAESDDTQILALLEGLALEAGREIMRVFEAGCAVENKADSSPVTEADRGSERIILEGLRARFPEIVCVAEEETSAGIKPGEIGSEFFLVDPLDGTKEFVSRRADFTVNIALIRNGVPEIGVVFAPCSGRFFSGRPGLAETLWVGEDYTVCARQRVGVREQAVPPTVVASRSHNTPETEDYITRLGMAEIVSVGSSLKFCLLAAGEADLYPRFSRTMEWDTAAGDAVLRAAGGMTRTVDGAPLTYGKRNRDDDVDFSNPFFIARGREPAA
ncbi:3'(2'), 5'-bisphosphate nucleotidase [Aquamicrobium ahrensii]|uniref:3'(2'),5'-bisphosphate nucleotidase CysQ n=2 Tax=Aquamicrobium ahrensii TaxID=469551 RepID=A0ABV2KHW5_9HYPH